MSVSVGSASTSASPGNTGSSRTFGKLASGLRRGMKLPSSSV
jgi:hypothetical protein